VHRLHLAAARAPQSRLGHQLAQRLPADHHPLLPQVLRRQRRAEIGVVPPHAGEDAPPELVGNLAVRRPAAQPVEQAAISVGPHPGLKAAHLAVAQPQPLGRLHLRQMALLNFV
jgi:hypothetical protein